MVEVCTVFCYCLLWLETLDINIMSVVETVWGSVGMFVV